MFIAFSIFFETCSESWSFLVLQHPSLTYALWCGLSLQSLELSDFSFTLLQVDATNEMKQLDRNQALDSKEALVTESVEVTLIIVPQKPFEYKSHLNL